MAANCASLVAKTHILSAAFVPHPNQLVVKAERKETQNGKNGSSYRYGKFQRTIPLADGAELDQIDARYHSGVLELHIPKGKEAQNTKRIAVKAA